MPQPSLLTFLALGAVLSITGCAAPCDSNGDCHPSELCIDKQCSDGCRTNLDCPAGHQCSARVCLARNGGPADAGPEDTGVAESLAACVDRPRVNPPRHQGPRPANWIAIEVTDRGAPVVTGDVVVHRADGTPSMHSYLDGTGHFTGPMEPGGMVTYVSARGPRQTVIKPPFGAVIHIEDQGPQAFPQRAIDSPIEPPPVGAPARSAYGGCFLPAVTSSNFIRFPLGGSACATADRSSLLMIVTDTTRYLPRPVLFSYVLDLPPPDSTALAPIVPPSWRTDWQTWSFALTGAPPGSVAEGALQPMRQGVPFTFPNRTDTSSVVVDAAGAAEITFYDPPGFADRYFSSVGITPFEAEPFTFQVFSAWTGAHRLLDRAELEAPVDATTFLASLTRLEADDDPRMTTSWSPRITDADLVLLKLSKPREIEWKLLSPADRDRIRLPAMPCALGASAPEITTMQLAIIDWPDVDGYAAALARGPGTQFNYLVTDDPPANARRTMRQAIRRP